jgi:hypothetical protein
MLEELYLKTVKYHHKTSLEKNGCPILNWVDTSHNSCV